MKKKTNKERRAVTANNETTFYKAWLEGLIENAKLVKDAAEKQGMPNGYSVLFHAELLHLLGYIESAELIISRPLSD